MDSGVDQLRHAAEILCDHKMLPKIAGIDLKAKEAKYYHSRRKVYLARAARVEMGSRNSVKSDNPSTECHQDTFLKLKDHIDKGIIIECVGSVFLTCTIHWMA